MNLVFMEGLFQRTMWLTHRPHSIQMDAPKTVKYGNKRLRTLGPHIWNSLPKHFKAENDFSKYKNMYCRCNLWVFLTGVPGSE